MEFLNKTKNIMPTSINIVNAPNVDGTTIWGVQGDVPSWLANTDFDNQGEALIAAGIYLCMKRQHEPQPGEAPSATLEKKEWEWRYHAIMTLADPTSVDSFSSIFADTTSYFPDGCEEVMCQDEQAPEDFREDWTYYRDESPTFNEDEEE